MDDDYKKERNGLIWAVLIGACFGLAFLYMIVNCSTCRG